MEKKAAHPKRKTVAQIKQELLESEEEQREALMAFYSQDDRKGVIQLLKSVRKHEKFIREEKLRLQEMKIFEENYSKEYIAICGIDEAGRGPLAGPVVAGACILPAQAEIFYLNDSKKVSKKKREQLFREIQEKSLDCGVGIVSPERIDEINILQATYEAMRQAVEQMDLMPDLLLVDAVTIPDIDVEQVGIIKGDEKSVSIAAASILAKVTRDRLMVQYDQAYPEYGFASNKGYGSAAHIAALKKYGPCPIHRRSFIKNFIAGI